MNARPASALVRALESTIQPAVAALFPNVRFRYVETFGTAYTVNERIAHAAWFIKQSVGGHEFMHRSRFLRRLHWLRNSQLFRMAIFLVIFIHLSFWRFEPTSHRTPFSSGARTMLGFELVFCVVYSADLLLKLASLGARRFVQSYMTLMHVAVVIVIAIDVLAALSSGSNRRVSRVFRPFLLIAASDTLRDIGGTVLVTIRKLSHVAVIYAVLVTSFAFAGMNLFNGYYAASDASSFDTFVDAAITLFLLNTGEGYPSAMAPAYARSDFAVAFFAGFIVLSTFVLLNVLIAVVLETYKEIRERKVTDDFREEAKALSMSFALLDVDNLGVVTHERFRLFMRKLAPHRYNDAQIDILYRELDQHHDGTGINRADWDHLFDVLLVRFRAVHVAAGVLPRCIVGCFTGVQNGLHERASSARTRVLTQLVLAVVLLNAVVLVAVGVVEQKDTIATLYAINFGCLVFFALEAALKMLYKGWHGYFASLWSRIDFLVLGSQVGVTIALLAIDANLAFGFPNRVRAIRVLQACFSLRFLRLITRVRPARRVMRGVLRVARMMLVVISLVVTVLYVFAIVGQECFAGSSSQLFTNQATTALTLFQLFTGQNWGDLLYAEIRASTHWAAVYFVAEVLILNIVVLNVLVAIVIDMFVQTVDLSGHAKDDLAMFARATAGRYHVYRSAIRWEREVFAHKRTRSLSMHIELAGSDELAAARAAYARAHPEAPVSNAHIDIELEPLPTPIAAARVGSHAASDLRAPEIDTPKAKVSMAEPVSLDAASSPPIQRIPVAPSASPVVWSSTSSSSRPSDGSSSSSSTSSS